jgi:multiple sugar transport system substrate-binding protein
VKKSILIFALILCIGFPAFAGGGSQSAEGDSSTVTLRFSYPQSGSNDALAKWVAEKKVSERFEATNPGIKVELTPITSNEGDYATVLALRLASEKTTPDIIMEDTYRINSDANAGYLAVLDSYVASWPEWSSYLEGTKTAVKATDGKIYGVPISTDARGIWYYKPNLVKAGISVPWQPKNWNDILDAARRLKASNPDIIPLVLAVGKAQGEAVTMQTFQQLLYGTGDTMFENGKWLVESKSILDTFTFISTVYKEGLSMPVSLATATNVGNVIPQERFPQGKVGLWLYTSTAASNWIATASAPIPDLENTVGYAACPTQFGGNPPTISMTGGWSWAIPAYSRNKDAAWKFLAFCGNVENATWRCLYDGRTSPRVDSGTIPEYNQRPFINEVIAFLEYSFVRPKNDNYPLVSSQVQTIVEELAIGNLTPQQAMEQYKANVISIVGKENTVSR